MRGAPGAGHYRGRTVSSSLPTPASVRARPAAGEGAPTFEGTFDAVRDVQGWMTKDQARRLWTRARELAPGSRIVEIGSFRGRSMIVLATAAPPETEVVAIDPHGGNDRGPQEIEGWEAEAEQDYHVFHKNLADAGVDHRVRHLREWSDRALDLVEGDVDLLYIDGAHRWRPARDDIRHWGDRVAPGGVMLIHDSFSSIGVTGALVTELFFSDRWRYEGRSTSMTQYRHVPLRGRARARNAVRQLLELPALPRNVLIKALLIARLGKLSRLLGHDAREWPH